METRPLYRWCPDLEGDRYAQGKWLEFFQKGDRGFFMGADGDRPSGSSSKERMSLEDKIWNLGQV